MKIFAVTGKIIPKGVTLIGNLSILLGLLGIFAGFSLLLYGLISGIILIIFGIFLVFLELVVLCFGCGFGGLALFYQEFLLYFFQ